MKVDRKSHHNNDKSNNKNENGKNNSDRNDKLSSSSSTSPQPLSPYTPNTPRLGIGTFDLTPSIAEDMRLPMKYKGALVQSVFHGSPAYTAGLKGSILDVDKSGYLIRRGDVIIAVDGHKVDGAMDIIKQLKKKHPGDLLNLVVSRNNQILNLMTKL
jgi:S1-C subfamily serine protease